MAILRAARLCLHHLCFRPPFHFLGLHRPIRASAILLHVSPSCSCPYAPLIRLFLLSTCTSYPSVPFVSLNLLSFCTSYPSVSVLRLYLLSACSSCSPVPLIPHVPPFRLYPPVPTILLYLLSAYSSESPVCSSYPSVSFFRLYLLSGCTPCLPAPPVRVHLPPFSASRWLCVGIWA